MSQNTHESYLLYVDDNPSDHRIVGRVWKRGTDKALEVCANGRELVEFLERCARDEAPWPKLVLLDLNMPIMSGFEALEVIRADRRFDGIPIVVLTTSQRQEDISRCYQLGANGYISKDFGLSELTATLRETHNCWFDAVEPRNA